MAFAFFGQLALGISHYGLVISHSFRDYRLPITDSTDSLQHQLKFHRLYLSQQFSKRIGISPASRSFAGIDQCEWVPLTTGNQFSQERVLVLRAEERGGFAGQFWKARMFADPMEPVFRIPIIRLSPMENGVQITAVGVFNLLHDSVRGIEMVVPEENRGANEFAIRFGKGSIAK